jgi:tRNA U34 5-methylaminomethyl-2-thiouridine-forming methyltransferase MnmC
LNTLSIQTTADGSRTIFSEQFKETYHSVNGAITESMHVFIQAGLRALTLDSVRIFEVGFGTGLNALLTFVEAQKLNLQVDYHSIELYPLNQSMTDGLEYPELELLAPGIFQNMHHAPWNQPVSLSPNFSLTKSQASLLDFKMDENYDLVYFDAFSPIQQPELWSEEVFRKLYNHMNKGGILTTYCAKGVVRRTMQSVGFTMERLPGPPGKREMLRATKASA